MLKGGSLIFAMVISLLIALICSSFILISYHHTLETDSWVLLQKRIRNTESGITLLLSDQQIISENSEKTIDLFGDGTDSVKLFRKYWGVLEIIGSSAKGSGPEVAKTGISGFSFQNDSATALILSDLDRPLSLGGKTVLKGDCYIPKMGFNRAYIEGKNFEGVSYSQGKVLNAARNIPRLNEELLKSLQAGFELDEKDSIVLVDSEGIPDSIENGFEDRTICYYSSGTIILGPQFLKGNIKIISKAGVRITKRTYLSGVIVMAPKITIEDEFTGDLQAFASDSLIAGKKVKLEYPSVLGVIRSTHSPDMVFLGLGEESSVKGALFGWEGTYNARKQVIVSLQKKTFLTGYAYCTGSIELKGTVIGTVICSKFLLKTNSGVYENHLLDAVIDRTALSPEYAGPNLFINSGRKKIMKWL